MSGSGSVGRIRNAVVLLGVLAAGCGGLVPAPSASSHPQTATPLAERAALTVAQNAEIPTLDPAIGYDIYSWPWERLIFETLVTYDADTQLIPRLAEAMPQLSEDGRTLSFTIRQGAKFVTPGGQVLREVTADDFVYSLNRVLNPRLAPAPSPVASTFFARIEGAAEVIAGRSESATGITAPDPRTLRITLSSSDPTFLNVLAMPFGSVVPREVAGTDTSAFSEQPVGTGPYLLAEWVPAQRARFIRNPHYWDANVGLAPEIEVRLGVDPDSQLRQVQAGTLLIMTDSIPPGQFTATLADARWAAYIRRSPQITTNFLAMDTSSDGPLGNVLVRRAISHAVDRQNIIRIKNGRGLPGTCIYPPLLPGYDVECDPYPYSISRGQELMAEAELANGFATRLYSDSVDPDRQVAQAIQQDLLEIGIRATLVPQPFDTLLESMSIQHEAPLFLNGWVMDFPDPADFVEPVLSCASIEGGFNPAWYCDELVDTKLAEARSERDPARRLETFRDIQRIIMDDAPWVALDYPEIVVLVSPDVEGFQLHPVWRFDFERYRVAD